MTSARVPEARQAAPVPSPAPAPDGARTETGAERVRYVFAVARAGRGLDAAVGGLAGPTGTAVRTVAGGPGLAAVVCDVPAGRYDEQGLRAQLEDLERLEALARAHHDVVATVYEHATVLPMRLATVYLDDARVARMLADRGAEFGALLDRLEGHLEWGVKVYADPRGTAEVPPPAPRAAAAEGDGEGAAERPGPGRAYLQRRRTQRRRHRDTYRAAGAVAERVAVLAAEHATDRVRHRPQQGELAAGPGENVANDAYLVPREHGAAFRAAITGLAEDVPGVRVELTGPWAPYSFATPPPEPAQGAAPAAGGGESDGR